MQDGKNADSDKSVTSAFCRQRQ